jgi:hypothetical protein
VIAIVQPLSSETFVKKPLICVFPKICAYFASARGEAKLTFCEVMMLFGVVFCASSIKGPTSLEARVQSGTGSDGNGCLEGTGGPMSAKTEAFERSRRCDTIGCEEEKY